MQNSGESTWKPQTPKPQTDVSVCKGMTPAMARPRNLIRPNTALNLGGTFGAYYYNPLYVMLRS